MARFLTTIPNNLGFYNLGTVESYPTGGAGPTAYGPTTYFGSDPLPARGGDNLSDPIDLGSFNSIFRTEDGRQPSVLPAKFESTTHCPCILFFKLNAQW